MAEHRAILKWARGERGFGYKEYSRDHDWIFPEGGGQTVRASAAPKYLGGPECVDPEEAYVAALASCHMLTFLAVASMQGFVVDSYEDEAVGELRPDRETRKMVISKVVLHPRIVFSGEKEPTTEELEVLHEKAHAECFLANSVKTAVEVAEAG